MTAVLDHATTDGATPGETSSAMRRCLACGDMKPRAALIRFVIGPDNAVVPDLAENLPGGGMWVSADAESVTLAAKKNLFAKAAQTQAKPDPDLAAQVAQLLRRRCLSLMGMAKGAGCAVLGEAQTEAALRANKIALHFHAADAARTLDNRYAAAVCGDFSRDELGAAFGYDQIAYAGLAAHGLTEKLKRELSRLRSMTTGQETL
ncbi:MAG: DUF448 domain-containing protein [Alphaproteobacteria bacterium]|nr:DUF448 domain-containing protein [Alphaproteobacteria bacterium]